MSPRHRKIGDHPAGKKASSQPQPPTARAQTAQYIATLCGELASMANGAGLGLTGHFLAMAKAEAESILEQDR